jgi:hypothetical protein
MVCEQRKPLSLDRYFMTELLMLNDTLMKYSIFFILAPAEERFGYFMQDGITPHTANETIQALRGVWGINWEDRILNAGLLPPPLDPQI